MNLFQWIFGKHVPRPPDPERSAALAKVQRWQAEITIDALHAAGIAATFSDDFTAYLTVAGHESTVTIFAMEPDLAAGRAIIADLIAHDESVPPVIRPIDASSADDVALLRAMLYEALFVPPGDAPYPPQIVDAPEIARYITDFGRHPGDGGWCAESFTGELVGAAWVRCLRGDRRGYGHVDDDTPELTIAVAASHRGVGIGTSLLAAMLDDVGRCSLSCDLRNPAMRLYERSGFVPVRTDGSSVVMLRP